MAEYTKKNKKVPGKKSTITIQGPSTYKSDLRGGALDEFVAPKVAKAKKKIGEIKQSARNMAGKVTSKVDSFKSKARKSGIRKYHNNTYKEGK